MKWCGSERCRLRPRVGPRSRRRRAQGAGPCRKARAGRYPPRSLLPCARRPGPAPLCSGNERRGGAACSSPGVPNRRRRPWRSPGGCRRPSANGERAGQAVRSRRDRAGRERRCSPRLPRLPLAGRRFGLGLPGEIGSSRAFFFFPLSLNVTRRVRSGFYFILFFSFLHHVALLWFLFPL